MEPTQKWAHYCIRNVKDYWEASFLLILDGVRGSVFWSICVLSLGRAGCGVFFGFLCLRHLWTFGYPRFLWGVGFVACGFCLNVCTSADACSKLQAGIGWILPPLCNRWTILTLWLFIALDMTPNQDCRREEAEHFESSDALGLQGHLVAKHGRGSKAIIPSRDSLQLV